MEAMPGKRPADSQTECSHILLYPHLNGQQRLFGGQLMEWMDICAAITARRHSGKNVTTMSVDTLTFHKPAFANDTLVLIGKVVFVGGTSMRVRVNAYIESLGGERTHINQACFVMVAIDEQGKPTRVPTLEPQTDEEKAEWERAHREYLERKSRAAASR